MEVCGTHTMAIHRHGIRSLLPENLRLISGPGCPVCVTPATTIERILHLAQDHQRVITTFGDMIRVPGRETSLEQARSRGAQVRAVYSPMDAVTLASKNQGEQVVFLGVGFETTAPAIAAAILEARRLDLRNFSVAPALKVIPPALNALLASRKTGIDALLCPGHVSVIIGSDAYEPIAAQYRLPCVVAGFEGSEILDGMVRLLEQIHAGQSRVENAYPLWVKPQGNPHALQLIDQVFEPEDAQWRGLGLISNSGLRLRDHLREFDAFERFDVPMIDSIEAPGCRCGEVLQGLLQPDQCALFSTACTPDSPVGPCMVSSEGACAAAHRFMRQD